MVMNPCDPRRSIRYNPLARVQGYREAAEIAHVLVRSANPDYDKEKFWYEGGEEILSIVIQTLAEMVNKDPSQACYLNLHNVLALLRQ